VQTAIEVSR